MSDARNPKDKSAAAEIMRQITGPMVREAIVEFSTESVRHEFHDSERYDLVVDGHRYPPKAIVGLAARHVPGGRLLTPRDFSAGLGSSCFRTLERLQFKVVKKVEQSAEAPSFEPGREYRRKTDIHDRFGGQERGGISTPRSVPAVFVFSGARGDEFGYIDGFRETDGVFLYTGEGQVGDMKMLKGNAAIQNAEENGKVILLFQEVRKGVVQFVGEADCIGSFTREQLDRDGKKREAIVFELALVGSAKVTRASQSANEPLLTTSRLRKKSLVELRELATRDPGRGNSRAVRLQIVQVRSAAVKVYVLKRANGRCEGCGAFAPFFTARGEPYLEPHHTTRIADGGPDHPEHVIALCPTCHRRAHSASDAKAYNAALIAKLPALERAADSRPVAT